MLIGRVKDLGQVTKRAGGGKGRETSPRPPARRWSSGPDLSHALPTTSPSCEQAGLFCARHFVRVFGNLTAVVGKSVAEKAVLSSKRYTAEEALAIGLVDKVVPRDKVLEATKSQMEEWTVFSGN